ncbi:hypothetical protein [Polynucleobacter asymbioticus]|jgi:hypothetical protein|uniref:Uncharacterized protein n=1 Tax=Polynucleobacter asymbioticus TaxID=576611 RepID=A0AAC9IRY9_9BURK|nr:hypothetical protein [Polynucleobacter asymbioticus]APC01066.1 hypothetical protein AOC25_05245 [Polynucleobacter asymbioticus]
MNISDKRIVLCRPEGGLNDQLSQIEVCAKYAENYGRILIVDTNYKHSYTFHDQLLNYFIPKQNNLIFDCEKYLGELNEMDVFPKSLQGRIHQYFTQWNYQKHAFSDRDSGEILSFNNQEYDEQLLVHHQHGGYPYEAKEFFKRVRLADTLFEELKRRLSLIGDNYSAIHIRNTDMKTDYKVAILQLKNVQFKKLFVGTDNVETLEYFIEEFGDRIYSFSCLPQADGKPLHYFSDKSTAFQRNKDAILDLIILAKSPDLHIVKVLNNEFSEYSGYSRLANLLNKDSQLLDTLIANKV